MKNHNNLNFFSNILFFSFYYIVSVPWACERVCIHMCMCMYVCKPTETRRRYLIP